MEQTLQLPVSKLSYSSLMKLLSNPLMFKMSEVLGVYTSKMGVSGMIGRAGHEALKAYYGGNPDMPVDRGNPGARALAKAMGLAYLDSFDDAAIHYGSTGSRETMLKGYSQAMDFYFAEEPEYHKILVCEEKMEAEVKTLAGEMLPLPITGIPDLVHERSDGKIEIIDVKFVTAFTNFNEEDWEKILQAQFMFHLLRDAKGITAERMLFREVKRTANQDGRPQIRDWAVPFDHEPYRVFFYNIFKDAVKFLSRDPIFLPNLRDMFDGEQAGLLYAQGLISSDMSDVEVMHKVRDVAFVSKKFVASRLDSEVNKHLLPEERVKVKLAEFGIPLEPVAIKEAPGFIQYRFKVSAGVRMSTIKKHQDDIESALEAKGGVRILAPIPGTSLVGIEIEKENRLSVKLSAAHFVPGTLSVPIGTDEHGAPVTMALDKMPHLLIAGATGSGKSVFLHSLIEMLTSQMKPQDMQLVLIDPKRVEFSKFRKKLHLREKVIYEHAAALRALSGLVEEMEARYKTLEAAGKRHIAEFNERKRVNRMPYIVVVIDEYADLILQSLRKRDRKEAGIEEDAETLIVRLAQMARAVGIHLVIATQRPTANVVTGLIKANLPTRISFMTASRKDSEIILDQTGAEQLTGKGDLLFLNPSKKGLQRLQAFC